MKAKRRQSLTFPSVMLIVSFWATALITASMGLQLLEILTLSYATVMSSIVVFLMFKTRNATARASIPSVGPPLAGFEASVDSPEPEPMDELKAQAIAS